MNRIAFALVMCCAQSALADALPVYTAPGQGGDFQINFENFDMWGGTTAGIAHYTTLPATPTWQTLVDGNASFWLTSYDAEIGVYFEPPADRTMESTFGFKMADVAGWAPLRDTTGPLTIRLLGYNEEFFNLRRGLWEVEFEGQVGSTIVPDSVFHRWTLIVPEPNSAALLVTAALILRRRARVA